MNNNDSQWWQHKKPDDGLSIESGKNQNQDQLSFWAVLAFTFILLLAPQVRYPFLAPLRIAMVTAIVALLAHVYSRHSRDMPIIDWIPVNRILFGLLLWIAATTPFSMWPGGSIGFVLENFSKTLIIFILLGSVVNTTLKLKRIGWGLVLMAIPLALTTIRNFLAGTSLEGNDRVIGYMASLTSNPNDMALMLNLILPIALAMFLDSTRPVVRIALGIIVILLVTAIIVTFSRAGFLTLGAIFVSYAWRLRDRPQRKWGLAVVLLIVFAIPFIPANYFERISTIVNVEEDASNSAQTRLSDMKTAVRLVVNNPLIGAGIGMNQLAMNEARGATWTEIHNVYLQYAVELGLPGLILFLVFFSYCLSTTKTVLIRCQGNPELHSLYHITEGIRVSLLGFSVAAMFHPVAYHFYFYYIAGLAVACGEIAKGLSHVNPDGRELNTKALSNVRGIINAQRT